MAEETGKQPAAVLVLVVVEKDEEQLQQVRTVRFVSFWALFNAIIFAISFAIDPAEVVRVEDDAVEARYTIWFVVVQAAAATLVLLHAGHRRKTRLALAYAALAATAVCHCMFASVIGGYHLAGDQGHLLLRIGGTLANFVFAGGDFFCLLALLFVCWEPGRSAHES